MKLFLLLIPVITTFLGILLYKFQNKELEIFKLDLVQFIYLFVLAPTFYIWMKSFLFFILKNELNVGLSSTDLFVIDTIFSVLSFIVMAAISMHSLTKTFRLKRDFDPEFDLFHLSEYFHLWWTHIVMWGGAMLLATFISISNVLVPFQIVAVSKFQFYGLLLAATILGSITFFVLWLSDAKQGNFMRLMKLLLAFFVVIHIVIYFILEPVFNMSNAGYWFVFFNFFSATLWASVFERYEHKSKIQRFREFFTHINWGNNIDLFKKNKK